MTLQFIFIAFHKQSTLNIFELMPDGQTKDEILEWDRLQSEMPSLVWQNLSVTWNNLKSTCLAYAQSCYTVAKLDQ